MTPSFLNAHPGSSTGLPSDPLVVHLIGREDRPSATASLLGPDVMSCPWPCASQFLATVDQVAQGCVIVDDIDDRDAIRNILGELGRSTLGMPVIVITTFSDADDAVAFMRMGAVDVILQPAPPTRLQAALATARQRLEKSRRRSATLKRVQAVLDLLTNREKEVLAGLTRGYSSKEIAKQLSISSRTVDIHRGNIMGKLEAESLSQALRIAFIAEVCGHYNPTLHVQ